MFERIDELTRCARRLTVRGGLCSTLVVSGCFDAEDGEQSSETEATTGGSASTAGPTSTSGSTPNDGTVTTGVSSSDGGGTASGPSSPGSTGTTAGNESSGGGEVGPMCGNGVIEQDEACDDANADAHDGCLSDCTVPVSCLDILTKEPGSVSGVYLIDTDGPSGFQAYHAHCEMERDGGGWTLVIVSADDGHDTWTWNNHDLMTSDTFLVGTPYVLSEDYKSPALHLLDFTDLFFAHEPSGVWAAYAGVGGGSSDVGSFMEGLVFPQCNLQAGYPMTAGDLTTLGTNLCSTDLYFHAGDYDGNESAVDSCQNITTSSMHDTASFGPTWNGTNNSSCPMDDPPHHGLGPNAATCDSCGENGDVEHDGRGFAYAMGLAVDGDRLEMYVR